MNKIEFGDNRATMKRWAEEGVKVQMCVTSPPYYGLRDYGTATWEGGRPDCDHSAAKLKSRYDYEMPESAQVGTHKNMAEGTDAPKWMSVCPDCGATKVDSQLGMEDTPEEFIENMVDVFRHVRDILADDGVIWVNMGDSYYNYRPGDGAYAKQTLAKTRQDLPMSSAKRSKKMEGLKNKDLIGIPWMLAFALRADGWYLRQDIIWHKPNPMPESVKDRCTKAHEYIFLLSKNPQYYYDDNAIKVPAKPDSSVRDRDTTKLNNTPGRTKMAGLKTNHYEMSKKRSVWTVNTKPYKGAHFATYPEELILPCILAGSKFGDTVLDPFMGSGTTAAVAIKNGRKYLGCELNESYGPLQQQRIAEAHEEKPPIIDGDPDSLFTFE